MGSWIFPVARNRQKNNLYHKLRQLCYFQIYFTISATKIYLRSTIEKYRLNELMLLNIHKNIKITPKKVFEEFNKRYSRKLLT